MGAEEDFSTGMQVFAGEKTAGGVRIWRCFSYDTKICIPEYLENVEVTEIAPYAFSAHMDETAMDRAMKQGKVRLFCPQGQEKEAGMLPPVCGKRLEKLVISGKTAKVGRYCFYNCENLESLSFFDSVRDWGSGAFTGCHQVKRIRIFTEKGENTTLKDVLAELHEDLCVEFGAENGIYARLYFPEYYEEGVENTPARILETHVHGSGLYYRNCFQQRAFDFQEYDSRFAYARAQENPDFLARLVMARLRFPYKLSEKARERYEAYVTEKSCDFAEMVVKEREFSGVKWLAENFGKRTPGLTEVMTELSGKCGYVEGLSYLMDFRHTQSGRMAGRRTFRL